MSELIIETAEVFEPLLQPARYKGAHGGRGSGKSHHFAGNLVEDHFLNPGLRSVCIREVQKSLQQSAKKLIEDKIIEYGLRDHFEIQTTMIKAPGGSEILFQGMQDHTAETIKSLEGMNRAWVEEAQTLSERSLMMLRPTIRAPESELWFSWNPRRKTDAVDAFLRGTNRTNAIVVEANWQDNPWFPDVLEGERLDDIQNNPEMYDHIWEGDYATISKGAYFAAGLKEAQSNKRIGKVSRDPLLQVRAYWDIGGTGAKADATAIWLVQFVGHEVRVLDHYEVSGEALETHVSWLRSRDYEVPVCVLPHDGATHDKVYKVSYESALRDAGFNVIVVPNQGAGAAQKRIEAVRRLFPSIWFNEETTRAGREALGWYHEKKDEARNYGLGPMHDWSSHSADAFGLMAIAHELHEAAPRRLPEFRTRSVA